MIRMTVTPGRPKPRANRAANDRAWCEWNGQRFDVTAFSATTALARKLVAAGCPDQPWESFVLGTRSLFGRSLHGWAKRMVTEDNRGIRFEVYREPTFPAPTSRAGDDLGEGEE